MTKSNKRSISVSLDEEIIEAVTDIATEERRAFSPMLNILAEEAIKKRGKKK